MLEQLRKCELQRYMYYTADSYLVLSTRSCVKCCAVRKIKKTLLETQSRNKKEDYCICYRYFHKSKNVQGD